MELAARHCTEKDIRKLEDLYTEAKNCHEKSDWENFLKTDEKIHTHLGVMTRNPVFQFVQKSIHDNIHPYYEAYLYMDKKNTLENLNDIKKIITALKLNDAVTASSVIMDHVKRFNDKMEETVKTG